MEPNTGEHTMDRIRDDIARDCGMEPDPASLSDLRDAVTRMENAMRDMAMRITEMRGVRNGGLVEEALGALDALRSETRIREGHPDPGAVRECFDTVEVALLAASEDTPTGRGLMEKQGDSQEHQVPDYVPNIDPAVATHKVIGAALVDGDGAGETRVQLQRRIHRYLKAANRLRQEPTP